MSPCTAYISCGIGTSLALMILALYLQRLAFHHLPATDMIVRMRLSQRNSKRSHGIKFPTHLGHCLPSAWPNRSIRRGALQPWAACHFTSALLSVETPPGKSCFGRVWRLRFGYSWCIMHDGAGTVVLGGGRIGIRESDA